MTDDWKPIILPADIVERVEELLADESGADGICLCCSDKFSEADMIEGTSYHLCQQTILAVYARMFDLSGDVTQSAMHLGLQVDRSWLGVIARMCAELEVIAPESLKIQQVKEKFGTLRVHYQGGNEAVYWVIEAAKMAAVAPQ